MSGLSRRNNRQDRPLHVAGQLVVEIDILVAVLGASGGDSGPRVLVELARDVVLDVRTPLGLLTKRLEVILQNLINIGKVYFW